MPLPVLPLGFSPQSRRFLCLLPNLPTLPGGTREKKEITEHQNEESESDSGLGNRQFFARRNMIAFLDRVSKPGCSSNQSSFQHVACINLESKDRPAPARSRRAWQERCARAAWVSAGRVLVGGWGPGRSYEFPGGRDYETGQRPHAGTFFFPFIWT